MSDCNAGVINDIGGAPKPYGLRKKQLYDSFIYSFAFPAREPLDDQGHLSEVVLVVRVPEQLPLRAGPFECDEGRRDMRLDDVLPHDIVSVEPLRHPEPLNSPRVVVDEVRLPPVCVSAVVDRTLVPRNRTVALRKTTRTVLSPGTSRRTSR